MSSTIRPGPGYRSYGMQMYLNNKSKIETMKKVIQNTPEYRRLTPYLATAIAEGFCEGENATEEEQTAAWQYLHDTGQAYRLQGWFGRQAQGLIDAGVIYK